jgi:energy-converting hydrogenase Eha subunit B
MPEEVLGGKVVGASVTGVGDGSPSMGGNVFGAVVCTHDLSHGIWIAKATVL